VNYAADRALGLVVASGYLVLPLRAAAGAGLLDDIDALPTGAATADTLNPILAAGRRAWTGLHSRVGAILGGHDHDELLVDAGELALRLPFDVADYVDFYSSVHHATNLGRLLRPGTEPLLPNWRHLPVGYHGRAGTIVVSGTPVRRPRGLVAVGDGHPEYRPTARLDIELEVGVVVGGHSALGEPVPIDEAGEHIFGLVVLNDWSARDIQAYEYQPLGPHLGKSFATSISAWVTPIDDLRPFLRPGPDQDPPPSVHLRTGQPWAVDLDLRVLLESRSMREQGLPPVQVSSTNFADLYWTIAQQLAHMTANGASLRPGDLYGSGTVSGPTRGTEGSFIELSWGGETPLELPDGDVRTFLEDGDRVILEGSAGRAVRLGPVEGEILPAAG
jgi:fumarylacetoacetase